MPTEASLAPPAAGPAPAPTPAPPQLGHIPILDVWRGTAIALLLAGHFFNVPKIRCGPLGVEFFLLLSGFLMGRLLFVKETPLGTFYRRRIARILPAAYAFLLAVFALSMTLVPEWRSSPGGMAACFLFVLNYFLVTPLGESISLHAPVVHFWSLCIEEHAYVWLSMLAWIVRRSRASALSLLAVSLALSLAATVYEGRRAGWDYYRVYWRSECRGSSILIGAIAACLAARGVGERRRYLGVRSDVLAIGLLGLGCLLNTNPVPVFVRYSAGTATLGAALLLASRHLRAGRWAGPMIWLGTVSYSLYLCQQPFYHLKDAGRLSPLVALGAAMAVGCLLHYLVESPARRFLNRRWGAGASS